MSVEHMNDLLVEQFEGYFLPAAEKMRKLIPPPSLQRDWLVVPANVPSPGPDTSSIQGSDFPNFRIDFVLKGQTVPPIQELVLQALRMAGGRLYRDSGLPAPTRCDLFGRGCHYRKPRWWYSGGLHTVHQDWLLRGARISGNLDGKYFVQIIHL